MKVIKHLVLILNLYILVLLPSFSHADVLPGQTFQQWGNEIMGRIEDGMSRWDGLYNNAVTQTWPDSAWGQGVMARALVAASKVDASYLQRAEDQADEFHLRYWCSLNGTSGYNAGYGGCGDRYYDDNAWIALALLELYDLNGDTKYLGWAQDTIVFCMTGENGPGDTPDGGIRWHENYTGGACICATAPTCLANLITYQLTGVESYRTDGLRLYNWMITSGEYRTASGLFHETSQGALGYLTAVVTQAAVRLYNITGDNSYLLEAQRMAVAMEGTFVNSSTHALVQFGRWGGHDMSNAFVELYGADGDTHWLDLVASYLEYLYVNGIDGATGFYPEEWQDISGSYSEGLNDNASVAAAFWKMADTPGGQTPFNDFAEQLRGRWMLDETTGTTASDSSGFGHDGTLGGASFSFDTQAVSGQWNGALQFDGTDDYIDLPSGFANLRAGMTISVWAYPTAVKNWARFVDMGNGEYDNNIVFGRHEGSNDLFFEAYDNTSSGGQVIASGAIQLNQWQMFTATLDASGNVVLYKNGSQVTTGSTALPSNIERLNNYIGRSNWTTDAYYQGRMDDVRIYNYVLSSQEVQTLYFYGGQAENPSPVDEAVNVLDVTNLEWTAGSLAANHDVYLGTDQTAVMNATTALPEYKGRQSQTTYTPALSQDTTYYWRIDEVTAAQDITPGHVWSFQTFAFPTQGLLAHYTMDNAFISGSTLIDTSGDPDMSGTLLGPTTGTTGQISQALNFDGVDDYADLPNGFDDFTGGMTVSVWAYPTAVGFWARFMDLGNGEYNNNIVFARDSSSNTLSFEAYNGSTSGGKVTAAGAITLNQWQLFTATLSPAGYVVLYKNGVKIASGQTAVPPVVTRINNYIGKSNWSDAYYQGRMDDFAIWSRALTSDEVMGIYNRGLTGRSFVDESDSEELTGYWQFNEGTGTTASDTSGNGNDGTLKNMDSSSWAAGKQCSGLDFDGIDDYLEVPDGSLLNPNSSSWSVAFWLRSEISSQGAMIISKRANVAPYTQYSIGLSDGNSYSWDPGQKLTFLFREASGSEKGGYSVSDIDISDWTHVTVVLDEATGTVHIYINGVSVSVLLDHDEQFPVIHNSSPLYIGANPNVTSFFQGQLDEVRIYNYAVSEIQAQGIYQEYVLIADTEPDGDVDLSDFASFSSFWQNTQNCEGDLTCDCVVDINDLLILIDEWLRSL